MTMDTLVIFLPEELYQLYQYRYRISTFGVPNVVPNIIIIILFVEQGLVQSTWIDRRRRHGTMMMMTTIGTIDSIHTIIWVVTPTTTTTTTEDGTPHYHQFRGDIRNVVVWSWMLRLLRIVVVVVRYCCSDIVCHNGCTGITQ